MGDDYEVGYGKPPRHTQFKKGRSGNPKGRPKGSQNFATQVRQVLNDPVDVNDKTGRRRVSTQMAGLLRLRERALKGDAKALDRMLQLARDHNSEAGDGLDQAGLSLSDQAILDNYNARQRRREERAAEPKPEQSAAASGMPEEDGDD